MASLIEELKQIEKNIYLNKVRSERGLKQIKEFSKEGDTDEANS